MNSLVLAPVFVNKARNDSDPAVRRFGDEGNEVVRFSVNYRVYDPREESKHRFIHINVVAFREAAQKVLRMSIKEKSCVELLGSYDVDRQETDTGTRTWPVMILKDIEFAKGNGQNSGGRNASEKPSEDAQNNAASYNQGDTYYQPGQPSMDEDDLY